MKTMAPDAPTSHTSARCTASTAGAAVIVGREPSAVAAYAIRYSHNSTQHSNRNARHCEERSDEAIHLSIMPRSGLLRCARNDGRIFCQSISVFVLRHQRQRRLEQNVEVEQHRPVLDVIKIELDALL